MSIHNIEAHNKILKKYFVSQVTKFCQEEKKAIFQIML